MIIKNAVSQYAEYRRNIGEKFISGLKVLENFMRFTGEDLDISELSKNNVVEYLYKCKSITRSWFIKYDILNGFFQWLIIRDSLKENLLPIDKPKRPQKLLPYIYSKDELKRLFNAPYLLPDKSKRFIDPYVLKTMLVIMYTLGLRCNEVLTLQIKDINLDNSIATIRSSKFYKTRIVTFNAQINKLLSDYLAWRAASGYDMSVESPLFVSIKSAPINHNTFQGKFRRLRAIANIERNDSERFHPRMHDLRHTFATHRLIEWYRQGEDVQSLLHVLSTYMGHTSIEHTSIYLTMTPELLQVASELFENYTQDTK